MNKPMSLPSVYMTKKAMHAPSPSIGLSPLSLYSSIWEVPRQAPSQKLTGAQAYVICASWAHPDSLSLMPTHAITEYLTWKSLGPDEFSRWPLSVCRTQSKDTLQGPCTAQPWEARLPELCGCSRASRLWGLFKTPFQTQLGIVSCGTAGGGTSLALFLMLSSAIL